MFKTKRGPASYFGTIALAAAFLLVSTGSVSAATAPALGAASTFAVLSGAVAPGEVGFATQAQIAVLNAFTAIEKEGCNTSLTGSVAAFSPTPGVVCLSSTSTLAGPITFNGNGSAGSVFLVNASGNLTFLASSTFPLTNGTVGGNVFVRADGNVTIPAGAVFSGTIIARGSVTIDPSARITGHVFSTEGVVSAPAGTVTCPECVTNHPTLTINKTVLNDNGGGRTTGDFLLLVNDMETMTGRVNILAPGTYTVGELESAGYVPSFTGACASNGSVTLSLGQNVTCNMLNNDIGGTGGGVGLPNTGFGGLADMIFFALRTVLIAGAAAGLTFMGLRAFKANRTI